MALITAAGAVDPLEGILEGKCVHDRGEHADIVGLRAVPCHPAAPAIPRKMFPTADDNANLKTLIVQGLDVTGEPVGDGRVDAVVALAHECLARNLEEHALVLVVGHRVPPYPMV